MLGVNFPFKIDAFVLNKSKITLSSSSLKFTFLSSFSAVEQPAPVADDMSDVDTSDSDSTGSKLIYKYHLADDISDLFTLVTVTAQVRS